MPAPPPGQAWARPRPDSRRRWTLGLWAGGSELAVPAGQHPQLRLRLRLGPSSLRARRGARAGVMGRQPVAYRGRRDSQLRNDAERRGGDQPRVPTGLEAGDTSRCRGRGRSLSRSRSWSQRQIRSQRCLGPSSAGSRHAVSRPTRSPGPGRVATVRRCSRGLESQNRSRRWSRSRSRSRNPQAGPQRRVREHNGSLAEEANTLARQ